MQTLTFCGTKIMSTRTAAGQFKGQFKGAMERYTWVRFAGKLTASPNCHTTIATVRTHNNSKVKLHP
jgi:hypothetical protein